MSEPAESIEIRTTDGRGLGAELGEPPGRALGTVVLAHPMFANRSVFARPRGAGVARLFFEAGWRTLAFDFRGHGESTFHGRSTRASERPWTYDDLVQIDLPAVVDAARARWPDDRLVVVGHSLGAHVALAAQGTGLLRADALVVAGANVWMRHLEPSRRVWLLKLATISGMAAIARRHGCFPVRALRLGTDDEATPYIEDFARFAREGRWTSRDGTRDYERSLAAITVPVLSLTSAGDRLYCRPECARRLLEPIARCTHHCIDRDDTGGPAPGHMALVTGGGSRRGWRRALAWLAGDSR